MGKFYTIMLQLTKSSMRKKINPTVDSILNEYEFTFFDPIRGRKFRVLVFLSSTLL